MFLTDFKKLQLKSKIIYILCSFYWKGEIMCVALILQNIVHVHVFLNVSLSSSIGIENRNTNAYFLGLYNIFFIIYFIVIFTKLEKYFYF